MSYYIATDKFGNYDLAHYGVKGMKWGVVNENPTSFGSLARGMKTSIPEKKSGSSGASSSSSSSSKEIWAAGRKKTESTQEPEKASAPKLNPWVVREAVEADSEEPKDEDEKKIAEANVNYQSALMNMQLLARISLSNGVPPSANPEYLAARKKAIEAKYELDKLTLAKQEKAVINPTTMAEQKQIDDSNAKKQLAKDKVRSKSSGIPEVDVKYTRPNKTGERAADVTRGVNRAKPFGRKK